MFMENLDVCWQQRFQNFRKALGLPNEAVRLTTGSRGLGRDVEDLMNEGLSNISSPDLRGHIQRVGKSIYQKIC